MKLVSNVFRILVGGLFIFSGLIKVNDPVGTAIKLEEYFEVFAIDFTSFFHVFVPFALPIAVFLCVLEIVLGVALLINYRMKATLWILLSMIVFFTFLTFYSAYFNKVTDCGCFGDAIKLTPWESFTKDIILLIMILFLVVFKQEYKPLFSSKVRLGIVASATIINTIIAYLAITHLPFIDFRSYKVGNHIPTLMKPSGELIYEYVMEKDGEKLYFSEYPTDKSLTFKELNVVNPEVQPKITDYSIWSDDGDFTESSFVGNKLFVIMYNVSSSNTSKIQEINTLAKELEGKAEVAILTSSDYDTFEAFRHEHQIAIPFYYSDATVLKTIIRSNPGLWLMKDGVVKGKWHYNDTPSASEINSLLN
jgi:uncharacterized membrane protein YphA (DoxX/SURF4 family)